MHSSNVNDGCKSILRDKLSGALYGFVIGDSMGATTEFMDKDSIRVKYGVVKDIIGGGWLGLTPGECTDDTQMMMCVGNAIMSLGVDCTVEEFKVECMKNFVAWFFTDPADIGNQCDKAIRHFINEGELIGVDDNALGNGSLMRSVPLALLGLDELNIVQGKLTHDNEECSRAIQMYSEALSGMVMGIYQTQKLEGPLKSSGYIWDTFEAAMHWGNQNCLFDSFVGPVNEGGDADTIAALSGALAGAHHGASNIPGRWVVKVPINVKKWIGKFVDFIIENVDCQRTYPAFVI